MQKQMENVHFRLIGPSWRRESIQQTSKTLGKISILASWAQVGFQDGCKVELARPRTHFQNLQKHLGNISILASWAQVGFQKLAS